MTEKQANVQGLSFTGLYVRRHDHEKAKAEAKSIRDQGFRAVVCPVPDSKYSRGPRGGGYSVYADVAYFTNRRLLTLHQSAQSAATQYAALNKDYSDKKLALDSKYKREQDEIQRLEQELEQYKASK